ncbi:hypothetical protein DUNSADRAFT_8773 [Dunaliella salina]|uniref:Flagellar associated protein n=1 Tax=Dunaliella salina TaxID=3046 RepID=A0ABQ7GIU3_DUNSA|nr:hypothetical protein DUNSADRAFT_8773 [Dunaliella salina]|eukprot:KAF5834522.1 hypothetical protein DUNSADRAFT_8773 [Dunaliella salina]
MTEATTGSTTAPRSWAEDLQTYRTARGSQSFNAVTSSSQAPKRFTRTCLLEGSFPDADGRPTSKLIQDPEVTSKRWFMHGWGDTTLLKQDGFAGTVHPRGVWSERRGRAPVAVPPRDGGRYDLYGVLSGTEAGGQDSWIGNPKIDPQKGKRAVPKKADAKGRTDLFELMQRRNPGRPDEDGWIGNMNIDPASGKAHPPPPPRGRGCLKGIALIRNCRGVKGTCFQGPASTGLACLLSQSKPDKMGKAAVPGACAANEVMKGATFKGPVPEGWSDLRRPHIHPVPHPVPDDTVREVLRGTASLDTGERRQKKQLNPPLGHPAVPRTDNLYSHLTYKPMSEVEQKVYSQSYDDAGERGRAQIAVKPGTVAHGKGLDMLAWRPEQQLGAFVPRGGLMQDGRRTRPNKNPQGGTLRGGTAPSMLSRF